MLMLERLHCSAVVVKPAEIVATKFFGSRIWLTEEDVYEIIMVSWETKKRNPDSHAKSKFQVLPEEFVIFLVHLLFCLRLFLCFGLYGPVHAPAQKRSSTSFELAQALIDGPQAIFSPFETNLDILAHRSIRGSKFGDTLHLHHGRNLCRHRCACLRCINILDCGFPWGCGDVRWWDVLYALHEIGQASGCLWNLAPADGQGRHS
mmetsp:Transcript_101465/g.185832  ORF Transcript_101465/g.185832 Transcript_101465/m.185832 type:complete len:205 (+) Transcript_101465:1699-2313(+)